MKKIPHSDSTLFQPKSAIADLESKSGQQKKQKSDKPSMLSKVRNRQELRDSYLRTKKSRIEVIVSKLVGNLIEELSKEIENV